MALRGIALENLAQKQKEPSTLDKISQGLNMAQSIIGSVGGVSDIMSKIDARKAAKLEADKLKQREEAGGISQETYEKLPAQGGSWDLVEKGTPKAVLLPSGKFGVPNLSPESKLTPQQQKLNELSIQEKEMAFKSAPIEQAQKAAKADQEYKKTALEMQKIQREINDPAFKLNATEKQHAFYGQQGLKAVMAMDEALSKGSDTFSLIGDNTFTLNERMAAEMFGRMQSGGAINKEEEKRFIAMGPGVKDNKKTQIEKLKLQREIFLDKIKSVGLKPDDLPPIKYGSEEKAKAEEKKQLTPEDKQAIDWAKKNSKDQKAQEILRMHGL